MAPTTARSAVQVGDALSYGLQLDETWSRSIYVDAKGQGMLPGCTEPVTLAGRDLDAITNDADRCLVLGELYESTPVVHIGVAKRAGSIRVRAAARSAP